MNNLQIFNNSDFGQIRAVELDGEAWLVGKDVAVALGYEKPRNAIAAHVDAEDKKGAPIQGPLGGSQQMTIINESGLYSLILSSKLPSAKKFKRWVTSEVLPAIRKTGTYAMAPSIPPAAQLRALTTDDYITAARLAADCRNERLPYVLGFLERGGFDIPKVESIAAPRSRTVAAVESTRVFVNIDDFLI